MALACDMTMVVIVIMIIKNLPFIEAVVRGQPDNLIVQQTRLRLGEFN